MCQYSCADDGVANDWHLVNLGHLALDGPGIAFFEATAVNLQGRITRRDLALYDDASEAAIARIVRFVRAHSSSLVGMQLAHAGRKASTVAPWEGGGPIRDGSSYETVAPSALAYDAGWNTPKALDEPGLASLRADFVGAAVRSDRAGIDVLELHAAHGYLLHQFLSPLSNLRTDAYGGSLANRMRFPLEVFDAVRAAWPQSKPLGVRLSATDYAGGGWNVADSVAFARELQRRGCDFVDVSGGGLVPFQQIATGPGYQVPFSAEIRRDAGIPTIAVGMIEDPVAANGYVERGECDMVALARGMLRNPRWVWSAADALGFGEAEVPNQYARARHRREPATRV